MGSEKFLKGRKIFFKKENRWRRKKGEEIKIVKDNMISFFLS